MRLILATFTLLAASILAACGAGGPTTSDKDILRLDYHQLDELIKNPSSKKPMVLVDTRSAEVFAGGHLPGAIHIPLGELRADDERFAGADKVIVYHEDIRGDRADIAAKKLMASGLFSVYSYRGGYQDWKSRQAEEKPAGDTK